MYSQRVEETEAVSSIPTFGARTQRGAPREAFERGEGWPIIDTEAQGTAIMIYADLNDGSIGLIV